MEDAGQNIILTFSWSSSTSLSEAPSSSSSRSLLPAFRAFLFAVSFAFFCCFSLAKSTPFSAANADRSLLLVTILNSFYRGDALRSGGVFFAVYVRLADKPGLDFWKNLHILPF